MFWGKLWKYLMWLKLGIAPAVLLHCHNSLMEDLEWWGKPFTLLIKLNINMTSAIREKQSNSKIYLSKYSYLLCWLTEGKAIVWNIVSGFNPFLILYYIGITVVSNTYLLWGGGGVVWVSGSTYTATAQSHQEPPTTKTLNIHFPSVTNTSSQCQSYRNIQTALDSLMDGKV